MLTGNYRQRIKAIHERLGIPDDYESRYGLPLQNEAEKLVCAGHDMFSRSQQMTPTACMAWVAMRDTALDDDVSLLLVSAFRGVDYQAAIIDRQLEQNLAIDSILTSVAAPGYSEHHTGCAIDLTTVGCPPLKECFEETRAFNWLSENAIRFGFTLSYPRDSENKIVYEPWHWMAREDL